MKLLRVRNFERFQHYRDRKPPWIKLYRSILDEKAFFDLTEAERFFLLGIFILASQNDNLIPEDQPWLKRALSTKKTIPIGRLIETGWIERVEKSADATLPKLEQVASTPPAEAPTAPADATLPKPEQVASTPLASRAAARSRETERETEKSQKQKGNPPADDRRRPFSEFFHAEFQRLRGARLQTDKSDFVALDNLLKRTVDDPGFSLEALKAMAARFFTSDEDFHVQQGHPLRFFCSNVNAFVGKNGNGKSSDRQALTNRLKEYMP